MASHLPQRESQHLILSRDVTLLAVCLFCRNAGHDRTLVRVDGEAEAKARGMGSERSREHSSPEAIAAGLADM